MELEIEIVSFANTLWIVRAKLKNEIDWQVSDVHKNFETAKRQYAFIEKNAYGKLFQK